MGNPVLCQGYLSVAFSKLYLFLHVHGPCVFVYALTMLKLYILVWVIVCLAGLQLRRVYSKHLSYTQELNV